MQPPSALPGQANPSAAPKLNAGKPSPVTSTPASSVSEDSPPFPQQAPVNLLSNAINYSPAGGNIDVVWRENSDDLIIDVANSGRPIPPEDAERVFEPFFQSTTQRTGPLKGSGIGLSVARECIEAQGGTLTHTSHSTLPICFRLICPAH